jgi:hypothetical protein
MAVCRAAGSDVVAQHAVLSRENLGSPEPQRL